MALPHQDGDGGRAGGAGTALVLLAPGAAGGESRIRRVSLSGLSAAAVPGIRAGVRAGEAA